MNTDPFVLVLFGARGDLARRMLFPSLYRLAAAGRLPDAYALLGSGRSAPDSDDEFRDGVRAAVTDSVDDVDAGVLDDLLSRLTFQAATAEDGSALAAKVGELRAAVGDDASTLIYLSVPPTAMESMITMLGREGLADDARLIIEKPFGTDLESSRALQATVGSVADEDRVYRIDHFLGKEAVQNILALRFANGLIEPAWDADHVESVQIDVPEDLALEGRGSFYESTGCFRDMVSTHLCQVLGVRRDGTTGRPRCRRAARGQGRSLPGDAAARSRQGGVRPVPRLPRRRRRRRRLAGRDIRGARGVRRQRPVARRAVLSAHG